jgi:hypothetical protein
MAIRKGKNALLMEDLQYLSLTTLPLDGAREDAWRT